MVKRLKEDSELYKKINEIEEIMYDSGILITGFHLTLCVDGNEFKIGRDQSEFPRVIDEPFILIND